MPRELSLRRPHDRESVGEGRSECGAGGMRHSSVNLNCRAGENPQAGVATGVSLDKTKATHGCTTGLALHTGSRNWRETGVSSGWVWSAEGFDT